MFVKMKLMRILKLNLIKMIKIDKKNKTAVINFHNLIYNNLNVEQSLLEFKDFFSFSLNSSDNFFVVNLNFNDNILAENYKKVCLELCNYIFILMKNKVDYEIQN